MPPHAPAPVDAESAWACVAELAQAEPDARAATLATLSPTVGASSAWCEIVRAVFPADGAAPEVRRLLQRLERLGHRRGDAKVIAAGMVDHATIQRSWADWTTVTDRDELRLRLELLGRCHYLDPTLVPLVIFFFRASVFELYKPAAIALGRHLHAHAALRDYLTAYAHRRQVDLSQPIVLASQRGRRRLLLATTTAAVAMATPHGNTLETLGLPAQPLRWRSGEVDGRAANDGGDALIVPEDPMDAAVLATAVELGLEACPGAAKARFIRAADELLERLADPDGPPRNRTLIQRLGALLVRRCDLFTAPTAAPMDAAALLDRWRALIVASCDAMPGLASGPISEHVAALIRLDELLRTSVLLPGPLARQLSEPFAHTLGKGLRHWTRQRLRTWWHRENGPIPAWLGFDAADDSQPPGQDDRHRHAASTFPVEWADVLQWARRRIEIDRGASTNIDEGPELGADRQNLFLHQLLGCLSDEVHWRAHNQAVRALVSFHLIDEAQYLEVAPAQVKALLEAQGLWDADDDHGMSTPIGTYMVGCIFVRLMAWEGPGSEEMVDARLLHRIDHPRALLALLPTRRQTALLSPLADAFEHQVRWRLQRQDGFSLSSFLYRLTVRQPHRAFWDQLLVLCADRTYVDTKDRTVSLVPLLQWLRNHCTPPSGSTEPSHDERDEPWAHLPLGVPDGDAFLTALHRARARLMAIDDPAASLPDQLHGFVRAVMEPAPDGQPMPDSLLGLLETLAVAGEPMLSTDYAHWQPLTFEELAARVREPMERVSRTINQTVPHDLADIESTKQAIAHVEASIEHITALLARHLPSVEARLVERVAAQLLDELGDWSSVLGRLHGELAGLHATAQPHLGAPWLGELTAAIAEAHPSLRQTLLNVLWQSLRAWAQHTRQAAASSDEAWQQEKALLDWGLACELDERRWSAAQRGHWDAMLGEIWHDLLTEALDQRREQRAVELLDHRRYAALRRQPRHEALLKRARAWCFDHYLLGPARRVEAELRPDDQHRPPPWPRVLASFTGGKRRRTLFLQVSIAVRRSPRYRWRASSASVTNGHIRSR